MTHRIYVLSDPRNGEVRYVGVTSQSLASRLKNHLHRARQGDQNHRCAWIRSLLSENLIPIITIVEETSDRLREVYWIAQFRANACDLTNGTIGGDGLIDPSEEVREKIRLSVKGFRHSEESKQKIAAASRSRWATNRSYREKMIAVAKSKKISEQHKRQIADAHKGKRWRLGQKNTPEHNAKIGAAHKGKPKPGKPHTEATKEKIRLAHIGMKHTEETKAKISAIQKGRKRGPFTEQHIQRLKDAWKVRKAKSEAKG